VGRNGSMDIYAKRENVHDSTILGETLFGHVRIVLLYA